MARILIAENSHIIALGLATLIKSFREVETVKMVNNEEECCNVAKDFDPDLILINTSFLRPVDMQELLDNKRPETSVIHVFNTPLPIDAPNQQISILDNKATLQEKIEGALKNIHQVNMMETEELSPREKAILKEVALGLTNKEIAEKTYISTHTVISHRKNITRKLGIKTVSGLTVYAILNNIIHMDDIS